MHVLVLNCGSSSLKFQIIETDREKIEAHADVKLASGSIERIGFESLLKYQVEGRPEEQSTAPVRDHRAAIDAIVRWLEVQAQDPKTPLHAIEAVGHRVVHGGERFRASVVVDEDVIRGIQACVELAPLHNEANLRGIRAAAERFGPQVPQVAVFDTAFHSTLPEAAYLYAIPYHLYRRHKIRRYGFHGTSHRYVAWRYRELRHLELEQVNVISLHLGNGCSACAIKNGHSIDTSMGFTPLEGLVMGTRSGDLDPAVLEYLAHKEGMTLAETELLLNKQSGLLGLSGLTGDMRDLLEEERENGDRRARLAIEVFCLRARQYIGAYLAEMGGADAVLFTGGIGEHSADIRVRICQGLEWLGLHLDPDRNRQPVVSSGLQLTTDESRLAAWAIPTNEELLIARDTVRCLTPS
ncbi:MAG TPA: acetate kinase [Candidatus Xenobia bacterium]|jgi:acetate kinase